MPTSNSEGDAALKDKLDDIRRRLMNPTRAELEAIQLNLDVLDKWDRLMLRQEAGHDHDHMDDHDHTKMC